MLCVQSAAHINNTFHIVVVIQVSKEWFHTFDCTIACILHISTNDYGCSAIIFHTCKSVQRNLWVKSGYHLSVILHSLTFSKGWIGNNNIILHTTLERFCCILLCYLCKSLLSQIIQSCLVKFIGVNLLNRNCEYQHPVTCRWLQYLATCFVCHCEVVGYPSHWKRSGVLLHLDTVTASCGNGRLHFIELAYQIV